MATHSSILAWEIPWTEEPGGRQSWGHKRVRHDLATKQQQISALLPNKSFAVFYRNIGDLQYCISFWYIAK